MKAMEKAASYSSLLRRGRAWWHAARGGTAPPPSAALGWQRVPLLGLVPRIRAIVTDPVGLVKDCHARYGDIFTIHIPLNTFDLTYLMDREGYQYVLDLDAERARMGKVMMNVPTVGFWFPRSDEGEPHLQALILGGRALMADLLRRREVPHEDVARKVVARHLPRWGAEVDLGDVLVELVHDAAVQALVGEALWERLRAEAGPALRAIVNGIDVVRVTLAKTPYARFMPEHRATLRLQAALEAVVEEHRRTGAYPVIDRIAAAEVAGGPLPAADVPWMLMSVLWNAVTYPGTYGVWAFCDLLTHPEVLAEVTAAGEADRGRGPRARLLSACLTETLRRSPVASLPRWLSEPMEIEYKGRRYRIGAGTYLAASPCVMNNDPATYRDADRYDPRRYDAEPAPSLFGRGAFGCVAQGFVYTLLTTIFDELLRGARFEMAGPLPDRVVRVHLTYPSAPIRARLTRREPVHPTRRRIEEVGRQIAAIAGDALEAPFRGVPDEGDHVRQGDVADGARMFHAQALLPIDPILAVALLREGDLGPLAQALEWRPRQVDACEEVVRYASRLPPPWHDRDFLTHQLYGAVDGELFVLVRDAERALSDEEIARLAPPVSLRYDSVRGHVLLSAYRLTPRPGGVRLRRAIRISLGLRGMPAPAVDALLERTLRQDVRALVEAAARLGDVCRARIRHDPFYAALEEALRASSPVRDGASRAASAAPAPAPRVLAEVER